MAFVEAVKCPSFHTQFLDRFECASSTLHFHKLFSVNALCALLHSKYQVFSTEVCDFGHSCCFIAMPEWVIGRIPKSGLQSKGTLRHY